MNASATTPAKKATAKSSAAKGGATKTADTKTSTSVARKATAAPKKTVSAAKNPAGTTSEKGGEKAGKAAGTPQQSGTIRSGSGTKSTASTLPSATASSKAPAADMRGNKAKAGSPNKMETISASKVTEVATKTVKAAPAGDSPKGLLTEAQILAMSDKDYMNEAQLAFFRNRLQELERELLRNAGETTEHLRETVLVPDPADRATIEEEHALELRTRDRERKLLKKIQQSLASIDTGDYGWCEETGEPIGIPRLLARPTATLSLEAQQRRELKQKLYGD